MLEILLEFLGEFVLEGLCALGDACIHELVRWVRELI
jgi:hypothetical protein